MKSTLVVYGRGDMAILPCITYIVTNKNLSIWNASNAIKQCRYMEGYNILTV